MASVAQALMSAEEFYEFANRPENRDRHFELEEGEVVEMSRPGEKHCVVCGNLAGIFYIYCKQRKKGRVATNDMGIVLNVDPDTVRGPDVSVYTDSKDLDECQTKYPDTLPTLVIEVKSPNDRHGQLVNRLNRFLDKGAKVVWLVDPEDRSVTVWWPNQAPICFEENAEIANLPGLPDFRCQASEIFHTPGS